MTNMFIMNNRMTHWTKNHQIFLCIIFSIMINMMNTQYFFNFVISTFFTFFNHPLFNHFFSNSGIFWMPTRSFRFSCAFNGTKFPNFTRRVKKNFTTIKTSKFFCSFINLRSVITQSRTIFCFITSRRNMFKRLITNLTISFNKFSASEFVFTESGTIFKCLQSIFRHITFFITSNTIQKFTRRDFHYASN